MFEELVDLHRGLGSAAGRDGRRRGRSSYPIGARAGNVAALLAFGLIALAAGCGDTGPADANRPTIRVAAASDLADALPEIIRAFEARHPARVESTIGSSGQLAKQIENGAPVDVFLSADRGYVDGLGAKGLIDPASVRVYAIGSLVLIARAELAGRVRSPEDLGRPEVRKIAIANPDHAPYGRAAKQALEDLNLWTGLEERLVLADTVRQAAQFVDSGNADAGLVSASLVVGREPAAVPVDGSRYEPLEQALGVVKESSQPELARAFADFVLGGEARAILGRRGLKPPAEGGR